MNNAVSADVTLFSRVHPDIVKRISVSSKAIGKKIIESALSPTMPLAVLALSLPLCGWVMLHPP